MKEEHRDLLRFLWWEDGNIARDPVEYVMTVHLFGATSSPGCTNFALKRTAQDHKKEFGTVVADFLRRDFYVDDRLKSCPTIKEANHLIKSVKEMCSRGGFNLHKFVSNKKDVNKGIPESDRAEGIKNIDLDLDKLPMERALGVNWCIQSDSFQFHLVLQDRPCTSYSLLSVLSSILILSLPSYWKEKVFFKICVVVKLTGMTAFLMSSKQGGRNGDWSCMLFSVLQLPGASNLRVLVALLKGRCITFLTPALKVMDSVVT